MNPRRPAEDRVDRIGFRFKSLKAAEWIIRIRHFADGSEHKRKPQGLGPEASLHREMMSAWQVREPSIKSISTGVVAAPRSIFRSDRLALLSSD